MLRVLRDVVSDRMHTVCMHRRYQANKNIVPENRSGHSGHSGRNAGRRGAHCGETREDEGCCDPKFRSGLRQGAGSKEQGAKGKGQVQHACPILMR